MPDLKISQFTDGRLVQVGDQIAVSRSNTNRRVQVGTAAAANIGLDGGEVPAVSLDSNGDPVLFLGNLIADSIDTTQANNWTKQQNVASVELFEDVSDEIDWDLDDAQNAHYLAVDDVQLNNPTNQMDGGIYTFRWVQDAATPFNLTYDAAYEFLGGAPSVSPVLSSVMIFTFRSDGVVMRGTYELFPA